MIKNKETAEKLDIGELDLMSWLSSQDEDSIRKRLYERVPEDLDTTMGSYLYDAIEPTTLEFSRAYFTLRNMIQFAFPQYSYGEWLTLAASSRGVDRNPATYATGKIIVEGKEGITVPKSSIFSTVIPSDTDDEIRYYITLESGTINTNGIAAISIQSNDAGKKGNIKKGENLINVDELKGITSIQIMEDITTGFDEENDESLLKRMLERVHNPPSSGNKLDYIRWTKEVPGVHDVVVKPLWNGPGTVKVIIMGENNRPIPELVDTVKEYLDPTDGNGDGFAPIGAVITVATIENMAIDIIINGLELEDGFSLQYVSQNIYNSLLKYVVSVPINGTIRIHSIMNYLLSAPGVKDFREVLLNGKAVNITIQNDCKASVGKVSYGEE